MSNRSTVRAISGLVLASALAPVLLRFPIMMNAGLEAKISDTENRIQDLIAANEGFVAALSDSVDFTPEQMKEINENKAAIETLSAQLTTLKALLPTTTPRRTEAEPARNSAGSERPRAAIQPRANPGSFGFANFGEFARTVHAAGGDSPVRSAVERLQNALTTYGNEGVGGDGGFLVPPDFRRDIAIQVMGEESLLARTDRMVTSSNYLVMPKDETTPYGGTGIQAYWEAEGGQKRQSKPALGQNAIRLAKLIALVPVTDELMEDAPALDGYLRRKTPEVMNAKINTAIIAGTGVGQPLGIINSPGLITVAKHVSQPGDSIWYENIVNMYSRMRAASLPRSVWLMNQSALPQLLHMSFDPGSAQKTPVFMPGGNIAGAPYGTLMGRPIIPIEAASAVGDLGDLIFADLSQYLTVTKGQDIKTDVSIHLFFDYDVTAFRFVFRVNGQPWWNSAVSPQQAGAPTLGQFIALAERT